MCARLGSLALLAVGRRRARHSARYSLLAPACVFAAIGFTCGHAANLRPLIASSKWVASYGRVHSVFAVTPYFFEECNPIPQVTAELEDDNDRRRIAGVIADRILSPLVLICIVLGPISMVRPRAQLLALEFAVAQPDRVAFHPAAMTDLSSTFGLLELTSV